MKASNVIKALLTQARQCSLDLKPWSKFPKTPDHPTGSLAIVGNAGYLADLSQGPLIDSHDYVIRMNNFRLKGYEAAVGCRVDGFMVNFYLDIDYTNPEIGQARTILSSVPNAFFKRLPHMKRRYALDIVHGMEAMGRQTVFVPRVGYFLRQIRQLSRFPSTGFMAVLFALDTFPGQPLYLTGFSFFEGRHHYFSKERSGPSHHDFLKERAILRERLLPHFTTGRVRMDPVMQKALFD